MEKKVVAWVGRNDGQHQESLKFYSVKDAEDFIADLEKLFPEEVHAGAFYIDVAEEAQTRG